MSVIYCLVAEGSLVIGEHTSEFHTGNFEKVSRRMLERFHKMKEDEDERERIGSKITYICDGYTFNILMDSRGSRVFMCLCSASAGRNLPYRFLDELQTRICEISDKTHQDDLTHHINAIIEETMEEFSSKAPHSMNHQVDKVVEGLSDVKDTMKNNIGMLFYFISSIEKMLSRGDKIDSLKDRSDSLRFNATSFKASGNRLHRHMCYRRAKSILLLTCLLMVRDSTFLTKDSCLHYRNPSMRIRLPLLAFKTLNFITSTCGQSL